MTVAVDSVWHRLCHTRLRDAVRGRIDGRLDVSGFIARADLPAEVAETIHQVVDRTRLWRREKTDVAAELVAHFQDGLERDRGADELVKSFGDPRQAARLIRRAKRRNRPLIWHLGRLAFWCVPTLMVVYTLLAFYLWTGRPTISTDYVAILSKEAATVPEGQAAWPLYRAALADLGFREGSFPKQIREVLRDTRPGDPSWPELVEYITQHAGALAKLRQAADRRNLGYALTPTILPEDQSVLGKPVDQGDEVPEVISVRLPHLQLLRRSAMLLAADARRALLAGDALASHADLTAMLRQSLHTQYPSFLVCGLNAILIQDAAFDVIQGALTHHPGLWSERQLADLAHQVTAVQLDAGRWLEGERTLFCDCVQRIYTDNGRGDGRVTPSGLRYLQDLASPGVEWLPPLLSGWDRETAVVVAGMPLAAAVMASRREVLEKGNEVYDIWLARLDKPSWQLDTKTLEQPLGQIERDDPSQLKYPLIHLVFPAMGSMKTQNQRYHGRREGVFIGIATELYLRYSRSRISSYRTRYIL